MVPRADRSTSCWWVEVFSNKKPPNPTPSTGRPSDPKSFVMGYILFTYGSPVSYFYSGLLSPDSVPHSERWREGQCVPGTETRVRVGGFSTKGEKLRSWTPCDVEIDSGWVPECEFNSPPLLPPSLFLWCPTDRDGSDSGKVLPVDPRRP